VDGAGRPLAVVAIVSDGRPEPPSPARLPLVRPGLSDPPRPGWLRLSWTWSSAEAPATLPARGVLLVAARTLAADPRRLTWRGLVAGWRLENGRRRHALARVPWSLDLPALLAGARGAGAPVTAHASGTVRAVALLCPGVRLGRGEGA
jgi:hypothetical protein